MSDVPSDLFREILIRVPTESLPRLKCVCIAWREIINDPVFMRLQLQHQLDRRECFIIGKRTGRCGKLYSLSLSSLNYTGKNRKAVEAIRVKNLSRRGVPPITHMPVPSCHGLILLCYYATKLKWAVWNPFNKDFLELPPYEHLTMGGRLASGGIGYDVISDDYKVVRIQELANSSIANSSMETLIYSMKSNTWRRIEDYPYYVGLNRCEYGVFHNDGLYCQFDIWKLKDDQGENIWDMFVSLKGLHVFGIQLLYSCPRLIFYSKTKQRVAIKHGHDLLWMNVEKKCGTGVSMFSLDSSFSCQAFPLSLIRRNGSSNYTCETTASKGTLKRKRTICPDRLPSELRPFNFVIPPDVKDA